MRFPIEKYRIIVHQNPETLTAETIAWSTYAGKVVKGKAICAIDDDYKEKDGNLLAVLRCALKIANKRKKNAENKLRLAKEQLEAAQKYVDKMTAYYNDSCLEIEETEKEIQDLLSKL